MGTPRHRSHPYPEHPRAILIRSHRLAIVEPGITHTAPRTTSRDIRRHEASSYERRQAPKSASPGRP